MGKTFIVDTPDGRSFEVSGPDDATPEQALNVILQKQAEGPSVWESIKTLPQRAGLGFVSGLATANAAFADMPVPEIPALNPILRDEESAKKAAEGAKVAQEMLQRARPFGAENSLFDTIVGGAAEGALASFGPALALGTINPALGLAAGLGTNYVLEAGSQWAEAKDKGATPEQIARSMTFAGSASTLLELPVLGGVMKRLSGISKASWKDIGKDILKTGAKEWGQEQATQHLEDIEANVSGWGNYSPSDIAKRGLIAGAQGFVLGQVGGGVANLIGRMKAKGAEKDLERALNDVIQRASVPEEESQQIVNKIIESTLTQPIDPQAAELQQRQFSGEFADIPNTEFGDRLGGLLDAAFGVKAAEEGEDKDVALVGEYVEPRRLSYLERGFQDTTPHADRLIVASSSSTLAGLRLGQLEDLPSGSVIAISGSAMSEEALFPMELAQGITDLGHKVAKAMGLTDPIIFTMEQLPEGSMGRYWRATLGSGQYVHVINPRELPSWRHGGNITTVAEFVGALTHELGHALYAERFHKGILGKAAAMQVPTEVLRPLMDSLESEIIAQNVRPETLASLRQFAPTEADLLERWSSVVQQAKKGELSGQQLAEIWWGPRKFSWGMAKSKNVRDKWDWLRAMERERAKNEGRAPRMLESLTARDIVDLISPGEPEYFFRLDEYMAEQFSRAAHDRNYLKGTLLGEWFQTAINRLRAFFNEMKDAGFIKPHETFERWLDEQTLLGKYIASRGWGRKRVRLPKALEERRKAQLQQRKEEKEAIAASGELDYSTKEMPLPREERLEISLNDEGKQVSQLFDRLYYLLSEREAARVENLIEKGKFAEAKELLDNFIKAQIKHDRQYVTTSIKQLPDKEYIRRETVRAIAGQQALNKRDKEALMRVLEKYEGGKIPRKAIVDAILSKAIYLSMEDTPHYALYGVVNLGFRQLIVEDEDAFSTHVWKTPYELWYPTDKSNHFGFIEKAFAHTRVAARGEDYYIFELQSDFMQKVKTPTEQEFKAYEAMHTNSQHDANLRWDLRDTLLEKFPRSYGDFELFAAQFKTKSVFEGIWEKVILRHEIAQAAKEGRKFVWIVGPKLLPLVEGWEPVSINGTHEIDMKPYAPHHPIDKIRIAPVADGIEFYRIYKTGYEEQILYSDLLALAEDVKRRFAFIAKVAELPFEYSPHVVPIMKRHEKLIEWARKEYKGEMDRGYLRISVPENAKEILLWDKGNPATPEYPNIEAASLAGRGEDVGEALDAWRAMGVKSPFFVRWWGNSKLTDAMTGEPIKLWHNTGNTFALRDGIAYVFHAGAMDATKYAGNARALRQYFVKMENPLIVDSSDDLRKVAEKAKEEGRDGVIVKEGLIYIAMSPDQIKDAVDQKVELEENDYIAWDRGDPEESFLARATGALEKLHQNGMWGGLLNAWRRMADALVQLQQRAATPLPDGSTDVALAHFLQITLSAERFKNRLQYSGERIVKALWDRSPKEVQKIWDFLEEEWLSGESSFDLQGWDGPLNSPNSKQIWGKFSDGGMDISAETGKLVKYWAYAPTEKTIARLKKHGIDVDTQRGVEVLHLIVAIKNAMAEQFTALEAVLRERIVRQNRMVPILAAIDLSKLYDIMQQIRLSPFLPQGHYGKWAISIEELKESPKDGERKWKLVRKEYYESKAQRDRALAKWHKKKNVRVTRHDYTENTGIPLQIPRELIDTLAKTGEFTPEQLELLQETLMPIGLDRIAQRYRSWSDRVLGGERDIIRNFANFIWHNGNFIWKMKFRHEFTSALLAENAQIRKWQKDTTQLGRDMVDMLMRNKRIMERVKEYLLYPKEEFYKIRQGVALAYLMFDVSTAFMNSATFLNTYSALTAEYGEVKGHLFLMRALADVAKLPFTTAKNTHEAELMWMIDTALKDGIIDQSYAFFIAGQVNTNFHFKVLRKGYAAKALNATTEIGMFPFRTVEKALRLTSMVAFFEAERARGTGLTDAYNVAVMRTNLLQNAYNRANVPELFRGKKALFTLFMSYVQFMTWLLMGGYAKALRADLASRNLKAQHILGPHAFTIKMWLLYMFFGGIYAGPGMEDLMDVVSLIWRKLYGTNLKVELRNFLEEMTDYADIILKGVLHSVFGMDLSASFSLGRVIPGINVITREWDTPAEFFGALATKFAGPFGGFAEDAVKSTGMLVKALKGEARPTEVAKELPGELGAMSRALDAYILQRLNPGEGKGVLASSGARLTQDSGGDFRDLTNWEIVAMSLGFTPTIVSTNKELRYWATTEQIYWRTRMQELLDARWKAINTGNDEMLDEVSKRIEEFNDALPETHSSLRITGKMMAESLKSHRRRAVAEENARATSRRMQPALDYIYAR